MHELPVTQEILNIALEHAQGHHISAITLVIGELSGFIDESIQFYFDVLAEQTPAAGARLIFKHIPIRFRCRRCGQEFTPQQQNWVCPSCQALGGDVISGKEFFVESIEIMDAIPNTSQA